MCIGRFKGDRSNFNFRSRIFPNTMRKRFVVLIQPLSPTYARTRGFDITSEHPWNDILTISNGKTNLLVIGVMQRVIADHLTVGNSGSHIGDNVVEEMQIFRSLIDRNLLDLGWHGLGKLSIGNETTTQTHVTTNVKKNLVSRQ